MKAEEEVHFHQQMKKLKLFQKKDAAEEKAETEKYLQLTEQYVRHIYFRDLYKNLYKLLFVSFIWL